MHTRADVRVVCRLRPMREGEAELARKEMPGVSPRCVTYDEGCIQVRDRFEGITVGDACTSLGRDDRMKVVANRTLRDLGKNFTLDAVLGEAHTQEDVYALVGAPVVHNVVEGYNGTVLAYGQTGSGKTHSMIGPEGGTLSFLDNRIERGSPTATTAATTPATVSSMQSTPLMGSPVAGTTLDAGRGLVPRVVEEIFNRLAGFDPAERTWSLRLSVFEIYMEEIIDLLGAVPAQRLRALREGVRNAPASTSHTPRTVSSASGGTTANGQPAKVEYRIREDIVGGRGVYIESLECLEVFNASEVLMLIHEAMLRRRTSATSANVTSSRSHSLVVLTLEQLDKTASPEGVRIASRLNLVDLAGSEKVSKTHVDGERLKEAQTINLSLTLLGNVIHRLTDGRSGYIPYRDSKLTRLLQDSLGGNSITTLLCHCSTSMLDREETLSTLRFAQRAKRVRNKPRLNRDLTLKEMGLQLTEAQQRVEMLEKELQLHREMRTTLHDKHSRDKREAEMRQKALVDSLRREIEQLREELCLKEGDLVHERDRVAFQRREKEQLADELAAVRLSHSHESAALEQALDEAKRQNEQLTRELDVVRGEMQQYLRSRSHSPRRHLSPRGVVTLDGKKGASRDVGVNTEILTEAKLKRLTALLSAGDDAQSEEEGRRRLTGDEVQRALQAAGTLIAAMGRSTETRADGTDNADADRAALVAAVCVLQQVMTAVSTALVEEAPSVDSSTTNARRAQWEETLVLADRVLTMWLNDGGQWPSGSLDENAREARTTLRTNDEDAGVVQPGHLLSRQAMSPLVRAITSLLAHQSQLWTADQRHTKALDGHCEAEGSSCEGARSPLAVWRTSMMSAYQETADKTTAAVPERLLASDALPKAQAAMQAAVQAQCAAHALAPSGETATWLTQHWVEDAFGPRGLVSAVCSRTVETVWSALHDELARHLARFTASEMRVDAAVAATLAYRVETHLAAALAQCQLDGTSITPHVVAGLFASLESLLRDGVRQDMRVQRQTRVAQMREDLLKALRDASKSAFRQQDQRLNEALAVHAAVVLPSDIGSTENARSSAVWSQIQQALLSVAEAEAAHMGPQLHKYLLRALRVTNKAACVDYEVAANEEDARAIEALLARRPMLCSQAQVLALMAAHAPAEECAGGATSTRKVRWLDALAWHVACVPLADVQHRSQEDPARARASTSLETPVLTAEERHQLATFLSACAPPSSLLRSPPPPATYVEKQIQALLLPELARFYTAQTQTQGQALCAEMSAVAADGQLMRMVTSHMRELVFPTEDGSGTLAVAPVPAADATLTTTTVASTSVAVAVTSQNAGRLLHALAEGLRAHLNESASSDSDGTDNARQRRRQRIADLLTALANYHVDGTASRRASRGQTTHSARSSFSSGIAGAEDVLTDAEAQQLARLTDQLVRLVDGANDVTLLEMEQWLVQCLECRDAQQRDVAIHAALATLGKAVSDSAAGADGLGSLINVRVDERLDGALLANQLALIEDTLARHEAFTPKRSVSSDSSRSSSSGGDRRMHSVDPGEAGAGVSGVCGAPGVTYLPMNRHDMFSLLQLLTAHRGPVTVYAASTWEPITSRVARRGGAGQVVDGEPARVLSTPSTSTPPVLSLPAPQAPATVDIATMTEPFWEADHCLQNERDDHLRHELTTLLNLLGVDVSDVCGLQPDEIDLMEATLRAREEVSYLKKVEEPAQVRALEARQRALACIYDAVKDTNAALQTLRAQMPSQAVLDQITRAATGAKPACDATTQSVEARPPSVPASVPVPASAAGHVGSRVAKNLQRQMDLAAVLATPPRREEDAPHTPHTPHTPDSSGGATATAAHENPLGLRTRPDVNIPSVKAAVTPDGKPSRVRTAHGVAGMSASPRPAAAGGSDGGSPASILAPSPRLSTVTCPSTTASLVALASVASPSPNKYVNPLHNVVGTGEDENHVPETHSTHGVGTRMRLDDLADGTFAFPTEAHSTTDAAVVSPSALRKADLAPGITHQCLIGCLGWTEQMVTVFDDLRRQADMARLRTERLDELLFSARDERDDCRQELDALKLVVAALRQENAHMQHVLRDLNIDLEAYMSNLAYQERLNKALADEAERERGKAERLRTTAEQQEFCEMGAVELAMKSEDTLAIEIGLRQVLTYSSVDLIVKKCSHMSKGLKKIDAFCQRMLALLQLRPSFNTGTLESQRLNLLQGLGDLMERVADAKETLRRQEGLFEAPATKKKQKDTDEGVRTSLPVVSHSQRAMTVPHA